MYMIIVLNKSCYEDDVYLLQHHSHLLQSPHNTAADHGNYNYGDVGGDGGGNSSLVVAAAAVHFPLKQHALLSSRDFHLTGMCSVALLVSLLLSPRPLRFLPQHC